MMTSFLSWCILLSWQHGIHGDLYPLTGATLAQDVDTNSFNFILAVSTPILGISTGILVLQKSGRIEANSVVAIETWAGPDLQYVSHPSGDLHFYKETSGTLITAISDDVSAVFGLTGFVPTIAGIQQYSGYTPDGSNNTGLNANTFQTALISDGTSTYLIFNYPPESMNWWQDSSGTYPTLSIAVSGETLMTVTGSGTAQVQSSATTGNTYTNPGKLYYQVAGSCVSCSNTADFYVHSCMTSDSSVCLCSPCVQATTTTSTTAVPDTSCVGRLECILPATVVPVVAVTAVVTAVAVVLVKKGKAT